jgi:hypothetical protein
MTRSRDRVNEHSKRPDTKSALEKDRNVSKALKVVGDPELTDGRAFQLAIERFYYCAADAYPDPVLGAASPVKGYPHR